MIYTYLIAIVEQYLGNTTPFALLLRFKRMFETLGNHSWQFFFTWAYRMDHTWKFLGSRILIHTLELKLWHFRFIVSSYVCIGKPCICTVGFPDCLVCQLPECTLWVKTCNIATCTCSMSWKYFVLDYLRKWNSHKILHSKPQSCFFGCTVIHWSWKVFKQQRPPKLWNYLTRSRLYLGGGSKLIDSRPPPLWSPYMNNSSNNNTR